MKISVVIPAYNEEKRIPATLRDVFSYINQSPYEYEIIVVDDGSVDKTSLAAASVDNRVRVLRHEINRGKGYSVKKGVMRAQGQYILFMDADGSTPIREIEKFFPYIQKNDAVMIGSRNIYDAARKIDQPLYRRCLGRLANLLIQLIAVWNIQDTQCGFKCFRKDVAQSVFALQTIDGWGFDFEILALMRKFGYTIHEVPIDWYNSEDSRVRPIRGALKTFRELLKVRWNLFLRKYEK